MERLNRYLAKCGIASRRQADELIAEGRVRVNAHVVTKLGTKIDPSKDMIQVGRRKIFPKPQGVALFHKPRHVVSTLSDPEGRECIADYLSKKEEGYFPVGRLDFESTGLVVLTNDGELADRLLHPRYKSDRVYEVRVSGEVTEKTLRRIARGVRLKDGVVKARAEVTRRLRDSTWLKITLQSGKNQVIRRLMAHLRHPVAKLHRLRHGPCSLGKTPRGEVVRLTDSQYQKLRERVFQKSSKKGAIERKG